MTESHVEGNRQVARSPDLLSSPPPPIYYRRLLLAPDWKLIRAQQLNRDFIVVQHLDAKAFSRVIKRGQRNYKTASLFRAGFARYARTFFAHVWSLSESSLWDEYRSINYPQWRGDVGKIAKSRLCLCSGDYLILENSKMPRLKTKKKDQRPGMKSTWLGIHKPKTSILADIFRLHKQRQNRNFSSPEKIIVLLDLSNH